MAIQALETYTTPEVVIPSKEFPNLWILDLTISARTGNLQDATAYINVAPCNSSTGEIDPSAQHDYRINLLEYLMIPGENGGYNPLSIAMGAVELAVPWVMEQKLIKDSVVE